MWLQIKYQVAKIPSFSVLLLVAILFSTTCGQNENSTPIHRAAMAGRTVILTCPLAKSQPPQIRWMDLVYNSNPSPQLIFDSVNNPGFAIASTHPNRMHYVVDENFTLTISNCTSDDSGPYMCYSTMDGKEHEQSYRLSVGEKLQCSGEVLAKVNDKVEFDCRLTFSGDSLPQLHWTATSLKGESQVIPSQDLDDVRLVRRSAKITVQPADDLRKYTCHMEFANLKDECSYTLNVPYPVQKAEFVAGGRSTYSVGDEVECTADGNPRAKVTLSLAQSDGLPLDQTQGIGYSSVIIPEKWLNEKVTIVCTAISILDGNQTVIQTTNTTFLVGKRLATPPPVLATTIAMAAVQAGSNTAVIVGIIIAIVIIVGIVLACVCIRKRKQKKKRSAETKTLEGARPTTNIEYQGIPQNSGRV